MSNDEDDFSKIRFQLLRSNPFFGSLIHRTNMEWDDSLPDNLPACTNGTTIKFQKKFFKSLTNPQQQFLYAHELMHCVFVHPWRMEKFTKEEDHMRANMAADYLINFVLKEMGFNLIQGSLVHDDYSPDKYTMESLMKLIKVQKAGKGGGGDGSSGFGKGDVQRPDGKDGKKKSDSELQEQEAEMKGILKQAAQHARMAGKGSAALDRLIDMWDKPSVDWKKKLDEFMRQKAKEETTWNRPSRRGFPLDLYLPVKGGYKCGHIGVAIDLSGSIGDTETKLFTTELKYLFEMCHPSKVTVVTFDDGIRDIFEFDEFPDNLKYRGGGGTDFRPVFAEFQKLANSPHDPLEALIFMTDLMGPFPDKHPTYPVFFLSTYKGGTAPFGEVVYAEELDKRENQ